MRFLLRSLFVWLMALVLPLQGIAAAGMQACGPVHERTGPAASAAHVPGHEHEQTDGHRGHAARLLQSPYAAQLFHSAHAAHSAQPSLCAHFAQSMDHGDAHPTAAKLPVADSDFLAAAEQALADPELPVAGHQCGVCAACCPAVAPPSEVDFATASGAGVEMIPAASARVASFVLPGLERPPRDILA